MIRDIKQLEDGMFEVRSESDLDECYTVNLNDADGLCRCNCPSFANHVVRRLKKVNMAQNVWNEDHTCKHIRWIFEHAGIRVILEYKKQDPHSKKGQVYHGR